MWQATHRGTGPAGTQWTAQYLVFIHAYRKVNERPPVQADLQRFLAVTAPSVHTMLLNLERQGLATPHAATVSKCSPPQKTFPP